jgi:predicted RNase H-like nuclease (RuvC/YqgF family)
MNELDEIEGMKATIEALQNEIRAYRCTVLERDRRIEELKSHLDMIWTSLNQEYAKSYEARAILEGRPRSLDAMAEELRNAGYFVSKYGGGMECKNADMVAWLRQLGYTVTEPQRTN